MQPRPEDVTPRPERSEPPGAGPPADPAPERIIADVAAGARDVIRAQDGRNYSQEGLDAFPAGMQTLIRALRQMPHKDAVRLTQACKGQIDPTELLTDEPGPELRLLARELGRFGAFDRHKNDLLRLLRTERPLDGYNNRESQPDKPQSFDPANELKITVKLKSPASGEVEEHVVTVLPLARGRASSIRTADDTPKTLEGESAITLGRGTLELDSVFGRPLARPIGVRNGARLGKNAQAMPRSWLRIARGADGRIRIFECGSTNIVDISVEETQVVELPRQAPQRRLLPRTQMNPATGQSQVFNINDLDEDQRRAMGLGGYGGGL